MADTDWSIVCYLKGGNQISQLIDLSEWYAYMNLSRSDSSIQGKEGELN